MPTIINDLDVISSSSDKAKHFASIFSSNSTLDDKGHPLPDFPRLTKHNLTNILLTAQESYQNS